ncbi:MAG: hypothetical protein ABIA59_08050, partial [Candidatus Latescibacterota bacterium]
MLKKYSIFFMLSVLIVAFIPACGGEGDVDPYALVTLHQVSQNKVVSKGFKYRFDNPQIEQLNDHLGLIREGSLVEFISGRSLESKLQGISGDMQLCVVKEYSPYIHFRVEKVYTEGDTVFISQAGAISYPKIAKADEFSTAGFTKFSLDQFPFNKTAFLKDQVDKKFFVTCKVMLEEEEGETFFVLAGKESKIKVVEPTDGISL